MADRLLVSSAAGGAVALLFLSRLEEVPMKKVIRLCVATLAASFPVVISLGAPDAADHSTTRPASQPAVILGSDKAAVDAMLSGWAREDDPSSTDRVRVFRYTKGLTMIVYFRDRKAVGVAVIDNPGAGNTGISDGEYHALARVIGQEAKPSDMVVQGHVLHEFSVGNAEYDNN